MNKQQRGKTGKQGSGAASRQTAISWWQLSLLGVACTIGTGYFLGAGIGLTIGGPAFLVAFLLAAAGTYCVFDALARMTVADPQQGSFRSYAKLAFGRWAGFGSGWVYCCSELMMMGSQMTALALFSRFWFPGIPIWLLSAGYAVLGLGVILTGTQGFDRAENLLAIVKVAAIVMFVLLASAILLDIIGWTAHRPALPGNWLPAGGLGLWSSLIYAFYAFGGIEVMGLMAVRLKNRRDAPRSGKVMLAVLAVIYTLSLGAALTLVPWSSFLPEESPFVIALSDPGLPWVPHMFTGVFIVAGFSTMVAALFAIISILVSLAEEQDAPVGLARKGWRGLPMRAVAFTAGSMVISILLSLLLPERLYELVTTAAGLMLLYNWLFILLSSGRLLQPSAGGRFKRIIGLFLIALAVAGTMLHQTTRPGFWLSLGFMLMISSVTVLMQRKWTHSSLRQEEPAVWEIQRDSQDNRTWIFELEPKRGE
ncbi:amino acid permease [Paenibacillus filicis]|uniref:Amino acid permease n=1 Tax=Paenibacillus filicis TaxID=669464 RepID=A0ABU9DD77_9BACL